MRAARRQLVAAVAAPTAVAEPDVVRRREAVRPRRVEACGTAAVHCAGSTAYIVDALVTVGVRGDLGRTRGERVDRFADKGELGVRGRDPVHHLLVGHEVRRGLCCSLVSTVHG